MAAGAEAAISNQGRLQEARKFADAVWTRFSLGLLNAKGGPQKQFVHLIHELGMSELALKIADGLKVCLSTLNLVFKTSRLRQEGVNVPARVLPSFLSIHLSSIS